MYIRTTDNNKNRQLKICNTMLSYIDNRKKNVLQKKTITHIQNSQRKKINILQNKNTGYDYLIQRTITLINSGNKAALPIVCDGSSEHDINKLLSKKDGFDKKVWMKKINNNNNIKNKLQNTDLVERIMNYILRNGYDVTWTFTGNKIDLDNDVFPFLERCINALSSEIDLYIEILSSQGTDKYILDPEPDPLNNNLYPLQWNDKIVYIDKIQILNTYLKKSLLRDYIHQSKKTSGVSYGDGYLHDYVENELIGLKRESNIKSFESYTICARGQVKNGIHEFKSV